MLEEHKEMKIVVDENVPLSCELFGAHGEILSVDGRALSAQMLSDLKPDALIVRSVTKIEEPLFTMHTPSFVGSCTIGIDHIDADYLIAQGVSWAHAPGSNAQSVVEYVTSALNSLGYFQTESINRIPSLNAAVIGCGRVGSQVYAELQALGFTMMAYDPFLEPSPALNLVSLEDAMGADVVCVHTPFTNSGEYPTALMISHAELARLPKNAVVINAGRGGVIDEDALFPFMKERQDIKWVFDVWSGEPSIDAQILGLVDIATPHIAGYSLDGKQNGSLMIYGAFCRHFGLREVFLEESGDEPLALKAQKGLLSFSEIVQAIYDPASDSAEMRNGYLGASEASRRSGDWFDRLRKYYPVRRERANYRLTRQILDGLSDTEQGLVKALGFQP